MGVFRTFAFWGLFVLVMAVRTEAVPKLFVRNLELLGGQDGNLVIEGVINGEPTFGVTILVALSPRPGARGNVTFSPAPPVDITQVSDPWPDVGTFSAFDTDLSGSLTLNGSVDDNETFLADPLVFSGPLASFPITTSSNALGTWDVLLSTSEGDSKWEGAFTALLSGVIEIPGPEGAPAISTWGLLIATLLVLACGTVIIVDRRPRSQPV